MFPPDHVPRNQVVIRRADIIPSAFFLQVLSGMRLAATYRRDASGVDSPGAQHTAERAKYQLGRRDGGDSGI